ncbi:LysR family transcriptional regulator [Sphingomonas alpina]|uniref:LysR family transcriptional regulator n=1 Tax=Sphingomonas alpina TaxID=653931 RepID=A0A7H0LJG4_9SPHN|nr:LysR family transcriptional regulator [Sphingomonas alpina]QNQ09817.1 LysR family transcriptional regulator [Sphingomonas alpina]
MRREDLGDLVAFLAVADERSFTRAAAKLGVSQSALSHTLRRLEARLGFRLLTRTTRSVAPTEGGERLIETLRPAIDDIDAKLAALGQLRDKPAGTLRITAAEHAARSILWPAIERLLPGYPDLTIEIHVDASLADIVSDRFDAGVRLGERLDKDMIAVPIGPELRMAAVAAPAYLARHPAPRTPQDLSHHRCINLRMQSAGGLYAWELERDGREVRVRVEGQLIFNSSMMIQAAAIAGFGIAFVPEDQVVAPLAAGTLVRVLEEWCEPFPGYYLYYPSRRQMSPGLALLVEALRYRG